MSQYIDDFTCTWNKVTVVTVQSQCSFHRHLHHALLAIFPDNGFHRHLHHTMHAIFPDEQSDYTILESSQIISSYNLACHFSGRQSIHISDNISPIYIYWRPGGRVALCQGRTALIHVCNQEVIESFCILYIVSHNTVVILHTLENKARV